MEYSTRLKKLAQDNKVPVQTIVMADLMAIGYTPTEAYNIAYSENASLSRAQNTSIRENVMAIGFKELVKSRREAIGAPMQMQEMKGELRPQYSKEEVASMMRRQIEGLPDGSKEKADVLMKYADLFSYKKEEAKADEEDIIRVWVPLTCDICPYKKQKEEC